MTLSSAERHRNRVATLARFRTSDDPELIEARTDLATAKLEQYIERVVADSPPLSATQRERLAGLLRGGETAW